MDEAILGETAAPPAAAKPLAADAARAGSRFVPSLQSLRGLAALTVCLFHAADIKLNGAALVAKGAPLRLLLNGHGAVVLFFVLSGFVLRSSLDSRRLAPAVGLASGFLFTRVFRLMPVVVMTVVVFALVAWLVRGQPYAVGDVVQNALLLKYDINGAFWTLQVEVLGSALVVVAFLAERRLGIWAVAAAALALALPSFEGDHVPKLFSLLYTFLPGYLAAAWPRSRRLPAPAGALLLAGSLVAFYWIAREGDLLKQWRLVVATLSAAGIVLVFATGAFRDALQAPPLRLLGAWSYSFYALHGLGIDLAARMAPAVGRLALPDWGGALILLSLMVAAALLLACPMYYLVELPSISLGKRLGSAVSRLAPTPSAASTRTRSGSARR